MGSNFQFTGAPKTAQYKPRGLDFFMAAPKLRAAVKGQAMALNQETDTNTLGIHQSDMGLANEMTSHLKDGKEKNLDAILSDEPVTDETIGSLIKNFNSANDAQEKFQKMRVNNSKIEQTKAAIEQQKLTSKDQDHVNYLNTVMDKTMAEWQGTYANGQENDFKTIDAPGYIDIKADFEHAAALQAKEMTEVEREAVMSSLDSFKISPVDNGDGTFSKILTYDKTKVPTANHAALDRVLERYTELYADPTSSEGQYMNFLPDKGESILKALPNIMADYMYTGEKDSGEVLQFIGNTKDPNASGKGKSKIEYSKRASLGSQIPNTQMLIPTTTTTYNPSLTVPGNYRTVDAESGKEIFNSPEFSKGSTTAMNEMFGLPEVSLDELATTLAGGKDTDVYANDFAFYDALERNGYLHQDVLADIKELEKLGVNDLAITAADAEAYEAGEEEVYELKTEVLNRLAEYKTEFGKQDANKRPLRYMEADMTETYLNPATNKLVTVDKTEEYIAEMFNGNRDVKVFTLNNDATMTQTGASSLQEGQNQGFAAELTGAGATATAKRIASDSKDNPRLTTDVTPAMIGLPNTKENRAKISDMVMWQEDVFDENNKFLHSTIVMVDASNSKVLTSPGESVYPSVKDDGTTGRAVRIGPMIEGLAAGHSGTVEVKNPNFEESIMVRVNNNGGNYSVTLLQKDDEGRLVKVDEPEGYGFSPVRNHMEIIDYITRVQNMSPQY